MTGQIIAVDLDGTLCENCEYTNEGFMNAKPRQDVIDLVNDYAKKGDVIIVWTGRNEEQRHLTEYWLKVHKVQYTALVMDKLRFTIYIDEKKRLLPIYDSKQ